MPIPPSFCRRMRLSVLQGFTPANSHNSDERLHCRPVYSSLYSKPARHFAEDAFFYKFCENFVSFLNRRRLFFSPYSYQRLYSRPLVCFCENIEQHIFYIRYSRSISSLEQTYRTSMCVSRPCLAAVFGKKSFIIVVFKYKYI